MTVRSFTQALISFRKQALASCTTSLSMKILSKIALFISNTRFNRRRKRYLKTIVLKSECKGNTKYHKLQIFFKENSKINQLFRFVQQNREKHLYLFWNISNWNRIRINTTGREWIKNFTPIPSLIRRCHIFWHTNIIIGYALIRLIQMRNIFLSHGSHHHISYPRLIC